MNDNFKKKRINGGTFFATSFIAFNSVCLIIALSVLSSSTLSFHIAFFAQKHCMKK